MNNMRKKMSISELESLLKRDDDIELEILPNGEIVPKGGSDQLDLVGRRPITFRENLGGEY